ncbi:MAG TPA: nuclear transport factor 2 family protein [Sphingobium sp.]|uniref:nuclear transport factor 2 family protein n=1 Tax=Sphingobium sp. TaxID=1912891 RepID=UPI002ED371C6
MSQFDREESYRLARAYFDAVAAGDLPDALLTPDMTGWITTGGTMDKARYQHLVRLLGAMLDGPLRFTINSLTADEDRVVAEAVSEGTLINGEPYAQTYVFVLRIRDGRIASVAEHYNALIAQETLVPLMAEAQARLSP